MHRETDEDYVQRLFNNDNKTTVLYFQLGGLL